jgi:hypothetical protein
MKALTIDAPWAWAIVHGHKRVENRSWRTSHRGPLAIHAGLSRRSDDTAAAIFAELGIEGPSPESLELLRGRVLGVVDVVDVVDYPLAGGDGLAGQARRCPLLDDPFATGPRCWLLAHPVPLDAPPARAGQQGLWTWPAVAGDLKCGRNDRAENGPTQNWVVDQ